MTTRRSLLLRGVLLGAGAAALFLVRDRLPWPSLRIVFANGRETPWQRLPPRGGLIEIPVRVNGAPIRAIVDSGAQFSAIDVGLAERLALPRTLTAPILAYGVSGAPSLTHTVSLDLTMPGLAIPHLHAAVLGLADISQVTGRDFQLLIGRDVLKHVIVEADFPLGRARFVAPNAYRPPPDAIQVPLRIQGGAPLVYVAVESAAPLEVLLDTGATGVLALTAETARSLGLIAPGRAVTSSRSVGLGGLSHVRLVRARSVAVAGLALHDVDVQVFDPPANGPAPSGLLGAGLLRRFRMVLDLGGARLFLVRPTPIVLSLAREPRP